MKRKETGAADAAPVRVYPVFRAAAVGHGIGLELQAVLPSDVGELRLDGFPGGIAVPETFLDDLFHDGDVPHVPEQAVHMDHVLQREPEAGEPPFHFVEGAVDLLLHRAADVPDAVAQETVFPRFDDAGMRPFPADILPDDFTHASVPLSLLFQAPGPDSIIL